MNVVEGFLRDLTAESVREGSFANVGELVAAIETYLSLRDLVPNRYVWKAERKKILKSSQIRSEPLPETASIKNNEYLFIPGTLGS